MKTLKTNRIFAVLMLASLIFSSFNLFAQYCGLQTESDGFRWERICQGEKKGAKSVSGTTFIPLSRGYTSICYHDSDGGYFSVKKNGQEGWGCCDITGREIVAPGRYDHVYYRNKEGYEYCIVSLNGKEGICDMNGREIILPRYDGVYHRKDDGYEYFAVELNGLEGVVDMNGREIIPPKYSDVYYHFGWFWIKINGKEAYYDKNGREIIAPGRYDEVRPGDGFLVVILNEKFGVCDINGKEIIEPKYRALNYKDGVFKYKNSSGKWVSTGIAVPKSYASGNTSNSSSPSSNTVSPTPQPQQVQPQPIHQPQPMQVWKQCFFCQGSGQCQTCLGTGHTLVYPCQDRCWNCGGTGKCTHCAGQGGHNEIEYH